MNGTLCNIHLEEHVMFCLRTHRLYNYIHYAYAIDLINYLLGIDAFVAHPSVNLVQIHCLPAPVLFVWIQCYYGIDSKHRMFTNYHNMTVTAIPTATANTAQVVCWMLDKKICHKMLVYSHYVDRYKVLVVLTTIRVEIGIAEMHSYRTIAGDWWGVYAIYIASAKQL